jgi:hypothetical protein
MNPAPDTSKKSETIRSDIDQTRQRMDNTIDAIGQRLQGRHLLDEVLGFFRSKSDDGTTTRMKEKISSSTGAAVNSVVDTVKAHPLPLLAIGAGVAWLIYESNQKGIRGDRLSAGDLETDAERLSYDPHEEYFAGAYGQGELPHEGYTSGESEDSAASSAADRWRNVKNKVSEKASEVKGRVQETAAQLGGKAKESMQRVGQRARDLSSKVQDGTRQAYDRSREQVVRTADEHPVELGLGLLAVGLLAGLALPTPRKVDEVVGPTSDRLRRRARDAGQDLVNRGRNVVNAATGAIKEEARAQGLTTDALRQKAGAVADRAKDTAVDSAQQQGMASQSGGNGGAPAPAPNNPPTQSNQPTF